MKNTSADKVYKSGSLDSAKKMNVGDRWMKHNGESGVKRRER